MSSASPTAADVYAIPPELLDFREPFADHEILALPFLERYEIQRLVIAREMRAVAEAKLTAMAPLGSERRVPRRS